MKKYAKILLFCTLLITTACRSQSNYTYWKTQSVEKIAGRPDDGIALGLNRMINEMNLHLTKQDDVLQISYPYPKTIKIGDFKSITESRVKITGQLLDSVYEVKQEGNGLNIKFIYNLPNHEGRKYALAMVQITKEEYEKQTENLKKKRDSTIFGIDILDLSALALQIEQPEYFDDKNLAHAVNPIQLAQELAGLDSIPMYFSQSFTIRVDKRSETAYNLLAIENTRAFSHMVAEIGEVYFDNLELIRETKKSNPELIMISKIAELDHLMELYDTLKTTLRGAKIEVKGLPRFKQNKEIQEIEQFVSMSWLTPEKTIKLVIEIPRKFRRIGDDQMILPYEVNSALKLQETFEHYLGLYGETKVGVFVLNGEFDRLLKANPNLVGIPTTLADYQRW